MNMMSVSVAPAAGTLPLAPSQESSVAIFAAAGLLLPHLERGERVDAVTLRAAMETAFGASDTSGVWNWKAAYDACEAATVLFLRKYGKALFRKAGSAAARLAPLTKIAGLLPTHTRRSSESQTFQQFSTPIPLGLAAAHAAAITPAAGPERTIQAALLPRSLIGTRPPFDCMNFKRTSPSACATATRPRSPRRCRPSASRPCR